MANTYQAYLANIDKLRELSLVARNIRHLNEENYIAINDIAEKSSQDFGQVKKNLEILTLSLKAFEKNLDGMQSIGGNIKETGEIEQEFVYNLANAVTISQLIEFIYKYNPEFWIQAIPEMSDQIILDTFSNLPKKIKIKIVNALQESSSS